MAAARSWKIPKLLPLPLAEKEEDKKDYRPKVVSIGPHFHGKAELVLVEKFKSVAIDLFVAGGRENKEFYLGKILEEVDGIRNLYDEEFALDKDGLPQMMLHDAAFIIVYMEIVTRMEMDPSVETTPGKFAKMKEHLGMLTVGIIARDLFLLQNQIPLAVINLLVYLRYGPGKVEGLLDRSSERRIARKKYSVLRRKTRDRVLDLHLLEASHRLVISDFVRPDTSDAENPEIMIPKPFHSFRTATDLKAKGIRFRPIPNRSSKQINFKSYFFFATLQLPSWAINVHTKVLLKNMVAYELSPGSPTEGGVLSYVNFMKTLVDGPEDVKVLREKGILSNLLANDEAAATMLNKINTFGLDNSKFFGLVEQQIQGHCKRRVNVWIAELLHSYFRTPWTITAFSAAVTVIAISAGQLYYAVNPPGN